MLSDMRHERCGSDRDGDSDSECVIEYLVFQGARFSWTEVGIGQVSWATK